MFDHMISVELVKETDPVLKTPAEVVTDPSKQVLPYLISMTNIMRKNGGIGLAAPQVGLSLRFFVTGYPELATVINPRIISGSFTETKAEEGCLSKPGFKAVKKRKSSIEVEFTDVLGQTKKMRLMGIKSRCFQHELDHLNGLCIF